MEFRRRWWMPSAHLETIYAACACGDGADAAGRYERRVVGTPDGDAIALDCINGAADNPLLVIFHGLEGSAASGSVRRIAAYFAAQGWNIAAPNFRTCGGLMNKLPRAYHAADTAEIDWMLHHCAAAFAHKGLFAAGISLGGNALINWASTQNDTHNPNAKDDIVGGGCNYDHEKNIVKVRVKDKVRVNAIATISAPFNLEASVKAMGGGLNHYLYEKHFLKTLKAKLQQKQTLASDIPDSPVIPAKAGIQKIKSIAEFDNTYTAPIHGFKNAKEYWQRGSCNETTLKKITLPLLCINAQNDPIVPTTSLPKIITNDNNPNHNHNPNIHHLRPKTGAHAAFTGTPKHWLPKTLQTFFTTHR